MAHIVPIEQVTIAPKYRNEYYSTRTLRRILTNQGQIEPMVVDEYYQCGYKTHDAERLIAAQQLEWATILITVMTQKERIEDGWE